VAKLVYVKTIEPPLPGFKPSSERESTHLRLSGPLLSRIELDGSIFQWSASWLSCGARMTAAGANEIRDLIRAGALACTATKGWT
jgi:hypothetical protein